MTQIRWTWIVFLGITIAIGCGPKEGGSGPAHTCSDGQQNGDEEGIDCGGDCEPCDDTPPSCSDGEQNGDEEGVDCGGDCEPCDALPSCSDGEQNGDEEGVDCGGECEPCDGTSPSCSDGEQNGDEEGVDCGGECEPCDAPPSCSDGEQNGDEEGVDCGGDCDPCDAPPSCSDGEQNGNEEGVDCGGDCDPCVNCVPEASRVFQTSQFYTSDFAAEGGRPDPLAGADALCQSHAMDAGLGGEWKAWLSTATASAKSRMEDAGPWYRVDRCTLVAPDLNSLLMDGPQVSISYDEYGEPFDEREDDVPYAWTGTNARGMATFDHCESWTSTDFTIGATAGEGDNSRIFDGGWTEGSSIPCDQWGRLYCFEQ